MQLTVTAEHSGKAVNPIDLPDELFNCELNSPLIHQVVTAFLAGARSGTKAQKSRSQVSGGGAKPWRQKGTGRARAGTSRSPIWRAGGVTFAASPRDYNQKVNRKMYKAAMRSIVSELARQGRLVVLDTLTLAQPKTKELVAKLASLDLGKVLIVTENTPAQSDNLVLAARNLPHVATCDVRSLSPVDLVHFDKLLLTIAALDQLKEKLQ